MGDMDMLQMQMPKVSISEDKQSPHEEAVKTSLRVGTDYTRRPCSPMFSLAHKPLSCRRFSACAAIPSR